MPTASTAQVIVQFPRAVSADLGGEATCASASQALPSSTRSANEGGGPAPNLHVDIVSTPKRKSRWHRSRGKDLSTTLTRRLGALDDDVAASLERADIRLVSVHWLLHQRPSTFNRMLRRQDLEKMQPCPLLPPKVAAKTLRLRRRWVIALTFGWGSPGDPDPTGTVLANVVRALEWFVREHMIKPHEVKQLGLFWECVPRTRESRSVPARVYPTSRSVASHVPYRVLSCPQLWELAPVA